MTQVLIDRATLEQLVGALEGVRLCTPPAQRPMVREAITAGRAALANAEPTQSKPVAYITDTHQGPMVWTPEMYGEACMYCDDGEFPVPLYTQPAQMRILTDEQIKYMWAQYCSYPGGILDFARAIREVK